MNALIAQPITGVEHYRQSTDAAGVCRDIVLKTAMKISGRQYVRAEGWLAIAIAHGCVASAEDVHRIEEGELSGYAATGVIRRMSDGAEIARAEGFLGDDEIMWTKRPVYARRAMVQTRAISRACRSAFAHVVVLIDANLSTTPAEEVPDGGFDDRPEPRDVTPRREQPRDEAPKNGTRKSSAAVIAAKNAILGTPTEQLPAWLENPANADALAELPQADQDEIMAFYKVTLKPGAAEAGTPFDDDLEVIR